MTTTKVRAARSDDLPAIEALRRADGADLGFVPEAKYEHIVYRTLDRGRPRWRYERLLVVEDNGDVTGFLLGSLGRRGGKIEQVCVRADARRLERALRLTEALDVEARQKQLPVIRCRVAADIEANLFWRAAGYIPIGIVTSTQWNRGPSRSQRPLILYEKPLDHIQMWPSLASTVMVGANAGSGGSGPR